MSLIEPDPEPIIWRIDTNSFDLAEHVEWERHSHADRHELLWATRGTLTAETADGYFAIPGSLGLWIPAGTEHRVIGAAGTTFRCTFIDAGLPSIAPSTTAVAIPEVVRVVLERLEATTYLVPTPRLHAEELTLILLEPVEVSTIDLPLPVAGVSVRHASPWSLRPPRRIRGLGEARTLGGSPRRATVRRLNRDRGMKGEAMATDGDSHGGTPRSSAVRSDPARAVAFSDAIIAIVITLLVLDLRPPKTEPGGLLPALLAEWPTYLAGVLVHPLVASVVFLLLPAFYGLTSHGHDHGPSLTDAGVRGGR